MNATTIQILSICFLGAALAACNTQSLPPPDTMKALETTYNDNAPAQAAALFTDDGTIMSEFGESVSGTAEIQSFLKGEIDKRLQYWITPEGSRTSGDMAYEFGAMRIRDTLKDRDLEKAKYLALYRKVGKSWKIERLIYNTNSLSGCTSVQMGPPEESTGEQSTH